MHKRARLIAFYLPQFHPIPENDKWWGDGFTEWTNVKKAQPLYQGHDQPRVPADLGYYDLRDPSARKAQADLARAYGIEGFCYWHYWFAGKRLLEKPFSEVLESGRPDFPFCLGWANDSWTGIWHGAPGRSLIKQIYPRVEDQKNHFYTVLEAFRDSRYIRIEGKPIFLIYKPHDIPNIKSFIKHWNELAVREGLGGIYFIANIKTMDDIPSSSSGFSALTPNNPGFTLHHYFRFFGSKWYIINRLFLELSGKSLKSRLGKFSRPYLFSYSEYIKKAVPDIMTSLDYFPNVVPNWDNTPRCGVNGFVLENSTQRLFKAHLREATQKVERNIPEKRIVFIKSWNEWAEGNYLEPDEYFGRSYLDVCRDVVEGI